MAGSGDKYETLLDVPTTAEQELQFQNFVLSDNSSSNVRSAPQYAFSGAEPTTTSNASFWNIEYYQQWFDVDSDKVLQRVLASLIPKENFVELVESNLELWGPFWIPTTVVFALFVTTSIANNIVSYMAGLPLEYDFSLLPFATTTCYLYAFLMPLVVWVACKWLAAPAQLLELVMIYGYGMSIWIPVAILSIIPSEMFRWILLAIAFAISAVFMVRAAHGITSRSEDKRASSFVLPMMLLAQLALAIVFKLVFFKFVVLHHGPPSGGDDDVPVAPPPKPTPTQPPGNGTTGGNDTMLFAF